MAQVPVYEGPQVRSSALQPVFQSTPDVSSGLQNLARGVESVAGVFEKKLIRDAETEANRVDNEITSSWLEWNAEAQKFYRGEKLNQYSVEADKWWTQAREKYGKDLSPMAREMIGQTLQRKRNAAFASIADYTNREQERFADQQAEAAANSAIEMGVDTGDIQTARNEVIRITNTQGARKGSTPEMIQAEQQRLLGTLHLTQIERLAQSDAAAAQIYYDTYKDEMPASSQARTEQLIKISADDQFATSEAARLASLTLPQQLEEAAKIQDPDRKRKTIAEIKTNFALAQEAERAAQQAASDQAWQMFVQGQKIPADVLARMDGRDRYSLDQAVLDRANRLAAAAGPKPVKTNPRTYLELRDAIVAGERVDLNKFVEKIALPELKELSNLQRERQSGTGQDSIINDQARINNALTVLGIDKKKDAETAAQFEQQIDRLIREASAAKGNRPLTPSEKQAVVDVAVMNKAYVESWWIDKEKPVVLMTPDELADAYVFMGETRIPVKDRDEIIKALRRANEPVTEAEIVRLYLEGK
jgi:hypothetical protein